MSHSELFLPIDRLLQGQEYEFSCDVSPSEMEVSEDFLKFEHPIHVTGKAYSVSEAVIYSFEVSTEASPACTVCCEFFSYPLSAAMDSQALMEEDYESCLSYDLWPIIREELLLGLPAYMECSTEGCVSREAYASILKQKEFSSGHASNPQKNASEEVQTPFSHIDKLFPLGSLDPGK